MSKATRAFIAVLVFSAFAAYAIPASATSIGAPPDLTGSFINCPWGYASATGSDLVAQGETVVAPSETDTVLNSFSFYVTQLFVGEPQTITYRAYVGTWNGQTVTDTVWRSDPQTVTTSADPAQWETTVETDGVRLVPDQQYALFFSTQETNDSNTSEDRGCGVGSLGNDGDGGDPYAGGASLVRYLGEDWRVGLFSVADVAFNASFSAYDFDGFYAPVNNKDANGRFVLNATQAGSAIPVKFSLGGDHGLDVFEVGYPKSQAIACDSQAPMDSIEQTVNAGASSLSYAAGSDTYNYVWKTDKAWADTCRQLVLKFDDGTTERANFKFR